MFITVFLKNFIRKIQEIVDMNTPIQSNQPKIKLFPYFINDLYHEIKLNYGRRFFIFSY